MLMLAYASVPLYRLFCQITGFGGTPRVATGASTQITNRPITISFNTNTDPKLPWQFRAPKPVTMRIGENKLVAFSAHNDADAATIGTSTYNVLPFAAGKYFNKIQCFCFQEQRLAGGQSAYFPVSFFIDPAILDDPELKGISNITLSYTFFSVESANKVKNLRTGDTL
jgi:cytochrome c oxidase assembly protein subunit 11